MSKTSSSRTESSRGAAPFSVRSTQDADMRTIALFGELDLATAPTLERELQHAETANARVIVLDLRELEFIDSTGLQLVVKAHRRGRGRLLLLGCPERVQRPFELCGLLELLTFVNEIPARNTAKTSVSNVAAADADRSSTLDTATMSRANQAAVADAVRQLRSPRRGRPPHRRHSALAPTAPLDVGGSDG